MWLQAINKTTLSTDVEDVATNDFKTEHQTHATWQGHTFKAIYSNYRDRPTGTTADNSWEHQTMTLVHYIPCIIYSISCISNSNISWN